MEIPDLVQGELGDEAVRAGVKLGDEDAVCITPTRTLVYRGEGLLSDEKVSVYPHDFERLTVSVGRRKTKLTLYYSDEKRELGVPGDRADPVIERVVEGNLRVSGVIDRDENVGGVFRFSELTIVVADSKLLKHLGGVTWDADFEAYPFEDVTGLTFEEGSVATALVLAVGDRSERIKVPAEHAPDLRETLQQALFAYHDVSSLSELDAKVGDGDDEERDSRDGLGLESGIDPLVGDDDGDPDAGQRRDTDTVTDEATGESTARQQASPEAVQRQQPRQSTAAQSDDTDLAALESQVAELTAAVERQNDRIERQERIITKLIEELRQGR